LQREQETGMAVVRSKVTENHLQTSCLVFEKTPELRDSRKALGALARKQFWCEDQAPFCKMVIETLCIADKKFLCVAVKNFPDVLACVSGDLRWDVDLVSVALDGHSQKCHQDFFPVADAAPEFLDNDPTSVCEAIAVVKSEHKTQLFRNLSATVHRFRSVPKAGLQKRWDVLQTCRPNSKHRNDSGLVQLAVKHNWKSLEQASSALKNDRDFVLSIVKVCCGFAALRLRNVESSPVK